MENMKVCWRCLRAIESREGPQATISHNIAMDTLDDICDWCKQTPDEGGFDELYELIHTGTDEK